MSKSSVLDRAAKLHILDSMCDHSHLSNEEKAAHIKQRFHSECGHEISRYGELTACTPWLQGLALNIEYMNHEIIELAKEWGSLEHDATEKQEQKILDNYWSFMANKCLQLMRGYRVPKKGEK